MSTPFRTILPALLLGACATTPEIRRAEPTEVVFFQEDAPSERLIRFEFVSQSSRDLCISADDWAWQGRLSFGSERASLIVGDVEYPMRDVNLGHCLDLETNGRACELRLRRGSRLSGHFSYEAFDLPETAWDEPKRLNYTLSFWVC